jgi:hypothetical protein
MYLLFHKRGEKIPPSAGKTSPISPRLSELNFHRLAGGLQRLEIELNADPDFLADQFLWYSP